MTKPARNALIISGRKSCLNFLWHFQLGNKVRTIIKATEPPSPSMSTSAVFRAGPNHHRVSMVAAIIPSPDWFLGVADFELCSIETKYWAENLTLNLYPIDAGTDSGMDFEVSATRP